MDNDRRECRNTRLFAAAQAAYDNMTPDEDECPLADIGAEGPSPDECRGDCGECIAEHQEEYDKARMKIIEYEAKQRSLRNG